MARNDSLRFRTHRALLVALCALIPVLLVAPVAAQAKSITLAVQDDAVFLNQNPVMTPTIGLGAMKKIHAKRIRINIGWTSVLATDPKSKKTPSKPTYDFSRFDTAVAAARAAGDTVQLTVTGPSPAWATHDKKLGNNRPDAKKFAAFAGAVASHFTNTISAISVYNEPNWANFLKPFNVTKRVKGKKVRVDGRPALYRDIYARSYKAIKKANKKMPVWIGELAPQGKSTKQGRVPSPLAFLRDVLCVDKTVKHRSCAGLKTDGLALHSYLLGKSPKTKPRYSDDISMAVLSRASTLLTRAEKLKALRLTNGKSGIPIYLTEFGYLTVKGSRGTTLTRQAAWIPQAIAIARKASRVKELLLYELIDPHNEHATWIGGLYKRDGKAKPVVAKLAALK
jgi:hypothetical protein